jgi:predicted nucleic acid-binding protein
VKIISNAGPLITLSQVGKLNLLKELYGTIIIPETVQYEVVVQGQGAVGAEEVGKASWINVQAVTNKLAVELLRERLDAGESEAIVLAMESKADLLLMDEARARRISEGRGIKLIGTLGLLAVAKKRGLITKIRPLLDQLMSVGFYMSSDLYQAMLEQTGEK